MTSKPQKAILIRTLILYGHYIQKGSVADVRHITDSYAKIIADRLAIVVPRHFIAIIPPDSPRVHKRKKKSKKRKKK